MEQTISEIIQIYGTQIWLSFVTLVVTGFILATVRDLVSDIVFYVKARFSDVGYGQRILYNGKSYVVEKIAFKYIVIADRDSIIRVPIKTYMSGPIAFPRIKRRADDDDVSM